MSSARPTKCQPLRGPAFLGFPATTARPWQHNFIIRRVLPWTTLGISTSLTPETTESARLIRMALFLQWSGLARVEAGARRSRQISFRRFVYGLTRKGIYSSVTE